MPRSDDLATCFPPMAGAPAGGISSMIYTSGTTGGLADFKVPRVIKFETAPPRED